MKPPPAPSDRGSGLVARPRSARRSQDLVDRGNPSQLPAIITKPAIVTPRPGPSGRALFLDRDGVINKDHGYVHTESAFQFTQGIFDLVQRFRQSGFSCIVVTNSAGIARGYFTEDHFRAFSGWLLQEFCRRAAPLDAIYYCPHHPSAGVTPYRRTCKCRKPLPGMILRAASEFGIDLSRSVLIGDRETDIKAGLRAGITTLFLYEGHARHVRADSPVGRFATRASALEEISPQW